MKLTFYITKDGQTSTMFLILLAVAASNFMLLGAYLFIAICLFYLFSRKEKSTIDKAVIPLFLFAIFYFMFTADPQTILRGIKIFACPLLWLVGNLMPDGKTPGGIFRVAKYLAMGMAIHGVLNLVYNVIQGIDITTGRSYDIFSGALSSATGQLINFTMFSAIVGYLIFFEPNQRIRIVAIIAYLVMLYYDIQIGGRTFLVLSLISFAGSALLYIFHTSKRRGLERTFLIIILIAIIIGLLIVCFQNDIFGIKTIFEDSYLFKRLEGGAKLQNNSRWDRKALFLENFAHGIWGGHRLKNEIVGGYAHDLWLDTYDEAGLLALITLLIYTVASIARVIRLIRSDVEFRYKALFSVYIIIMMLQFFVEVILQGAPMLLYSYIVIDGMIAKYCAHNRERREYERKIRQTA